MLKSFNALILSLSLLCSSVTVHAQSDVVEATPVPKPELVMVALKIKKKQVDDVSLGAVIDKRLSSQSLRMVCFDKDLNIVPKQHQINCEVYGLFHFERTRGLGGNADYTLTNLIPNGKLFSLDQVLSILKKAPYYITYRKKTSLLGALLIAILLPPLIIPMAIWIGIEDARISAHNNRARNTQERLERLSKGKQNITLSRKKFELAKTALIRASYSFR